MTTSLRAGVGCAMRLFERFDHGVPSQPTNGAGGHGGGAGLGLSIAQAIAHAHGGHIDLRPSTDRSTGACFRVSLPRLATVSGELA